MRWPSEDESRLAVFQRRLSNGNFFWIATPAGRYWRPGIDIDRHKPISHEEKYIPRSARAIRSQRRYRQCCFGGIPQLTLSSCAGWPVCTGPVTITTTSKPISCATIIPVTISDYSSIIASASSSLAASGTHYQTTLSGDVVGSSALSAASSLQSSASAAGSSLQASGCAAVSSAESSASAAVSTAATTGSGSSGASEIKLQARLIAGSLLVGAVALLL